MQSRQLTQGYYGVPNHDDASYSEIYARYETSVRNGTATSAQNEPLLLDSITGEPIMVKAEFMRVGQIAGELPVGFLEADICFVDADFGRIINSMTRTVAVPLVGNLNDGTEYDMSAEVGRMKLGQNTSDDDNKIANILLYSPQAFALAV